MLHTSKIVKTVDEQMIEIKNLRLITGLGLMDCKRALNETNWDISEATVWLRNYIKYKTI